MPAADGPGWTRYEPLRLAAERPRVRLNQVGYLPGGPKRATLVSDQASPVPFDVRRSDGAPVFTGTSVPWVHSPDPTSGLDVHVLDFSSMPSTGDDLHVVAGTVRSHAFGVADGLYAGLARDALEFFRLQRSGFGVAPPSRYARPPGHLGVTPNRGDTDVACWSGADADVLYPGWSCQGRFDVRGGWYDAGDFGKYATSGAIALWQLLATLDARTRSAAADLADPMTGRLVDECRWQLDWLMRMQVPRGEPLAGMVFHRVHGTEWSPMPGLPHEDPTERVLHRPSTPATLALAAVGAQAARLLRTHDPGYADRALRAAATAYRAARNGPELVPPDDEGRFGGGPYGDPDSGDDCYWAAAELWLATGDETYLADLRARPEHTCPLDDLTGFDYASVTVPARLDLASGTTEGPDGRSARESVLTLADSLLALQHRQPWGQPYAPAEGWEWGSNGRLLNNLVVLASAHELSGDHRFLDAVTEGVDHVLGRNALGQCYVTGYGSDATLHQRTRQYGHDLDDRLPPPPPGALAGGPASRQYAGFPQDPRLAGLPGQVCYLDEPLSETTNDVCIRWNAPLVFVTDYLDRHR